MVTSKYFALLTKLHVIEARYGSIVKAPEGCKLVKEVQDLAGRLPISKAKFDHIKLLLKRGYGVKEIARISGVYERLVRSICDNYGFEPKRQFNYILYSPNGRTIYVENLIVFIRKFFKTKRMKDTSAARYYLTQRGWDVLPKKTIWIYVPKQTYYHVSYLDKVVKKVGNKSYVYKNDGGFE